MLLAALAHAECVPLIDDDLTDGVADGELYGGYFSANGWVSDGGTLYYNFDESFAGRAEFVLRGLEEDGVSQSDIGEMFDGRDADFNDGVSREFLQLKFAGDIYGGYDGRIKMHVGGVYGDDELAMWTEERDWNAADRHTFVVEWDHGYVTLSIDGVVSSEVDYHTHNGGEVGWECFRLPNNGGYAYDPLLNGVTIERVSLCGEVASPPQILSWDIQPRELGLGELLSLNWSVSGDVDQVIACGRNESTGATLCSGSLGSGSGSTATTSDVLTTGPWSVWLEASGSGTVTSSPISLTVHEAGWTASPQDTGTTPTDTGTGSTEDPDPVDSTTPTAEEDDPRAGVTPGRPGVMPMGCATTRGSALWALALLALRRRR